MSASDTLTDKLKKLAGKGKQAAEEAIAKIASLADSLELKETAGLLTNTRESLRSDNFHIIVMGRFKNGKSTLLNSLMGGTTHQVDLGKHKGPMVVDDLPATAVLTGVRYSATPYIKAWHHDGKSTSWSLGRYLEESVLDIDENVSQRRFGAIREFEMGFPAKLCEAGVIIYDSPGLDEADARTLITRDATKRCDAAIVVYRSDVLMGKSELTELKTLIEDRVPIFTIVNLFGGRPADDRLRGYIWNKYVRDYLGGPSWANQDLSSKGIYLLDANRAREARYSGDEEGVAASGLLAFEQRLGDFLIKDRHREHLGRFVTQADNLSSGIAEHISKQLHSVKVSQDELRERHASIQPRLAALRERPNRIPELFTRCRQSAEPSLISSFHSLIDRIRVTLPGHMETVTLPSDGLVASFKQTKLLEEAGEAISLFVTAQIEEWARATVPQLLEPVFEGLEDDIAREVANIGRQIEEIHLDLTGWHQPPGSTQLVSPTERVLSAVGSMLAVGPVGLITGGAGGWRGALGSAAGGIGAAVVMAVLGVTSAVVFWPVALGAAIVAGVLGGNIGMGKRAKAAAVKEADSALSRLPGETEPIIRNQLRAMLDEREQAIATAVAALIAEEERNIAEIIRINQQDQAERERSIARLHDAALTLVGLRKELSEARVAAAQG